ncbi:hypothetical protein BSU04_36310 [Caballeronia sordidicola]|uniref:Uncharacterized protein n=1 Tax=Caballeronia sordidicola TaxID=196367 RepID=A0A226WS55_CABSO|nr:hypothetical protein BSU04_36310 [Caballeronia sordidicola]
MTSMNAFRKGRRSDVRSAAIFIAEDFRSKNGVYFGCAA